MQPTSTKAPTSPWQHALAFSERFGNMLSRTLLTVLYYGVLGPFALLYRLAADPLHLRRRRDGNWTGWVTANDTLSAARKQD
jgi:hypothetical protein